MVSINATAYKGGNSDYSNPTGFGLRVSKAARDTQLEKEVKQIQLFLVGRDKAVDIDLTKRPCFWRKCPEFVSRDIGVWLSREQIRPLAKRAPTEIQDDSKGARHF